MCEPISGVCWLSEPAELSLSFTITRGQGRTRVIVRRGNVIAVRDVAGDMRFPLLEILGSFMPSLDAGALATPPGTPVRTS